LAQDTIFALATAPGRSAVAVVRISGDVSRETISRLAGGRAPSPRRASLRALTHQDTKIDEALVLWFPGPHSYTGEDSGEFHLHGGVAVVEALQRALIDLGLRPAEPGEFTRRAFENGKLDLAQAEGVADLIDAQTRGQARQALAQVDGALSARHEAWRSRLIEALAMLEANVDFPDEALPDNVAALALPPLRSLMDELQRAVEAADRGQRVRDGYRIALIGAPNAGKSSLLNALVEREAAIVTAIAGTTRDVVEVPLDIAGYRVLLADTAGIRQANDEIEAEGVRRARAWADQADLRLCVVDSSTSDEAWREAMELVRPNDIVVLSKSDLAAANDWDGASRVSTVSGAGLAALVADIESKVVDALAGTDFPAATRARHAQLLRQALSHLERAASALHGSPELAAEDVRLAARALGRVTGRIDPEDVLEQVFAKFCIGK
jgi:tRNA modification GTPase